MADFTLNLDETYLAKILQIRRKIRKAERQEDAFWEIDVVAPYDTSKIITAVVQRKSLYILAFKNSGGNAFYFNDYNGQVRQVGGLRHLEFKSNYDTLKAFADGVDISKQSLNDAIKLLAALDHRAAWKDEQKQAAARMAFCVSEAIRFHSIAKKIFARLKYGDEGYVKALPSSDIKDTVNNWQSKTQAGSTNVAVDWVAA